MARERPTGMGSFLCAELMDFAAAERRQGGPVTPASCGPGACAGLAHLPDLARAAAPSSADAADALLRRFGTALFRTLVRRYPTFFVGIASTADLLAAFEHQLADEITKLAPHVALPSVSLDPASGVGLRFRCRFPDGRDDAAPLVEGLVAGSARHFDEPFDVGCERGPEPGLASFVVRPRARAAAGRNR
ncbi:heme NO-binding domain-containing protein [Candidatus Binatia bacterium]|nr:heme NO-binding domain-containing protein [Candidatus Binatia bacterium]